MGKEHYERKAATQGFLVDDLRGMSVVVTGIGVVSPLGVGIRHAWTQLLLKKSGIAHLGDEYLSLPSQIGGRVPKGSESHEWDASRLLPNANLKRTPLFCQYALAATHMALDDAAYAPVTADQKRRTGVAVGSGIGGIEAAYDNSVAFHTSGYKKVSPYFVTSLLVNMVSGHISIDTGITGPNHSVSTACATGAHAIGDAANLIRLRKADVMIAGSAEACLHPISVAGFSRARSLCTEYNASPEKGSRPFDSERCGFVIAEGAAILILESREHAVRRNARIYAELAGYGMSGDAFHVTAPHSGGDGARASMRMALDEAAVDASRVRYVNAHATSTRLGDEIEAKAIESVFGPSVPVSSTKGATGHLLGAAGSLEAAFTVMALLTQALPPTVNLNQTDIESNLDLVTETRSNDFEYALTNSFGFGGTNASLLFKRIKSGSELCRG